ncbi:hypothetical protein [Citrobacter freundii]|uniref:hypothetical protein n=1 Tax=Citrobacter freundii TaxID=546 RepID=UPI000D6F0820|nr:hypothetical protein [Citrobacter freundii]MDE9647358.1 hypothetical protein [Citrobacter freundii]MDE9696540.1 hypothetical protein [Citrobacter freundii]MDE9701663.1 hypothetical protein [Citrobacter freundii]MEB0811702.1 hypothetical protein [Citrobacter freundii]HEE9947384.1 hypothetical protein [Citrobacter freundii]
MTTIIAQDSVFVAVDQLWTDVADRAAPAPFRKYFVLTDTMIFLSGNIDPILSVLAGYVGDRIGIDEEFADWIARYTELDGQTCSFIEIGKKTGQVLYSHGADPLEEMGGIFYFAGSGSGFAIETYLSCLSILQDGGTEFRFVEHGMNLITRSMRDAFSKDPCTGPGFDYMLWADGSVVEDKLMWFMESEIEGYHQQLYHKIIERFQSIDELKKMIAMMTDELIEDEKEMEIETKIFDRSGNQGYSSATNLSAKGRDEMSNTKQETPRVAVKTSGSSRGAVLSASSLKARLAQRKAEGLN